MSRVPMTPKEYLAFERASVDKHGYVNGRLFPMARGNYEHSLLVSNVTCELSKALCARGSDVLGSDIKIKVPAINAFLYADVFVVCGTPIFGDETRDSVLNPKVIIEVLSDVTESYDRGEKFTHYRSIESLRDYALVSSKKQLVEHFAWQAEGEWLYRALEWGDQLELPSLGCEVSVSRMYRKLFRSGRVVVGTEYRTAEDEELVDMTQLLYEELKREQQAIGFARGHAEVRAELRAKGFVKAIVVVHELRSGPMPSDVKVALDATTDEATLISWLQLAQTSSGEVFAATVLASRAGG